jgi:hypothetical protein
MAGVLPRETRFRQAGSEMSLAVPDSRANSAGELAGSRVVRVMLPLPLPEPLG